MDAIGRAFIIAIVICILVVIGVGIFGYGCHACSTPSSKEILAAPCAPIFPNGDKNVHYYNAWNSCAKKCGYTKSPSLDFKTCDCRCE